MSEHDTEPVKVDVIGDDRTNTPVFFSTCPALRSPSIQFFISTVLSERVTMLATLSRQADDLLVYLVSVALELSADGESPCVLPPNLALLTAINGFVEGYNAFIEANNLEMVLLNGEEALVHWKDASDPGTHLLDSEVCKEVQSVLKECLYIRDVDGEIEQFQLPLTNREASRAILCAMIDGWTIAREAAGR